MLQMHTPVDYLPQFFAKLCVCVKQRKQKKQRKTYIPLENMNPRQARWQDRWRDDYVPNDKYKPIRGIERGYEGFCLLSKSKRTGKLVVMKYVQCPEKKVLPKEAEMLLEELRPHPNIVRAFAAQRAPEFYRRTAIHMEYCSGGDLINQLSHFSALGRDTPPIFALHVFIGLTNALAYLHYGIWRAGTVYQRDSKRQNNPIIHCDIKPDNVLLRWRSDPICGMPDIVLADFGAAQFENNSRGCDGGTYDYFPPEARAVVDLPNEWEAREKAKNAKILTAKSDMYSLGILMYLVAAWKHWRCGRDPQHMKLPPAYSRRPTVEADRADPNQRFIYAFQHALTWCLQPDPDERPECSHDMKHGLLPDMDCLKRQRDRMFKEQEKPLPKEIWNMNTTHTKHEDEETPAQKYEVMSTGSRSRGVGKVDSLMMPLTRVRANPH